MSQLTIETIASLAHEINRVYCMSMNDHSQLPWAECPDWQKQSAVNGVQHLIDNPEATPQNSHENWLKFKQQDGWVYGEVKDAEAKTHPCMVPYNELPETQQFKDAFFHTVVRTLIPFLQSSADVQKDESAAINDRPAAADGYPTAGMQLVDASFNPGKNPHVDVVKMGMANAADNLMQAVAAKLRSEYNTASPTPEQQEMIGKIRRLEATAKTYLEIASMLGVKAVTR